MATSSNLFVILAIAATVLLPVSATEFWVGGPSGWTVNVDYQAWASDKVFHVGDTLVFNYTMGIHNVCKVNATAFQGCIKPPENLALATGHDVVTLASPGKKWYICGKKNHCSDLMMKLVINVEGQAPAPAPQVGAASAYATSSFNVFVAALLALGIISVFI